MTTSTAVKKLSIAAVGAACIGLGTACLEANPAQAASLSAPFTFSVPLGGSTQTASGTVTFDSNFVSPTGFDVLNPGNGLESLSLSLLGNTYTESASLIPTAPFLFFRDGGIEGLLFSFQELTTNTRVTIVPFFNQVIAGGNLGDRGTIDFGSATPVPTPALLPGLIGLGMGITALRKRQSEKSQQA